MTTVITGLYGPFRYTSATDTWWWADDRYRIHGFEPGEIVPTTALLVAHKHPDDAAVASAIIRNAFTSGEPFALWHRILDARRRLRQVVSVGDGHWEDGRLVEIRGYMVDVTGNKRAQTAKDINEAVRRSAESRATIEQAKGILMITLGLDQDAAFETLKRASQEANTKLRDLADKLVLCVEETRGLGEDPRLTIRTVLGGRGGPDPLV